MSPQPYEKTSLISAFAGSCRGTAIFTRLVNQHPLRALFHLALLTLICALAVSIIDYNDNAEAFNAGVARFERAFGGVENRGGALIRPTIEPDRPRSLPLPEGGVLEYVPGVEIPPLPAKSSAGDFKYLFYWFPGDMAIVFKRGDDEFLCKTVDFAKYTTTQRTVKSGELAAYLSGLAAATPAKLAAVKPDAELATISGSRLGAIARNLYFGFGFFLFWIGSFLQILFYTLVFVAMFLWTGGRNLGNFNFRKVFVCAIYAGFPVLPVACAFPAFDLPLLSFGTAYVIGMIIYLLTVLRRFEPPAESNPYDDL